MEINRETLDKLAHLARLKFDEDQAEDLIRDLTQILNWVEKLNEVDTENVEPLTSMSYEINRWREKDKVGKHMDRSEAFRNAPDHDDNFFKVPKVLE